MKITFLGTGSSHGIPVIGCECNNCNSNNSRDKRLRSSVFIETAHSKFIVDVGPDFRQQMLREKITHIDFVLLTHQHKDHTAGLDDLRAYNYLQKGAIPIHAEEEVLDTLKREYSYVFSGTRYPGAPKFDLNQIQPGTFTAKQEHIQAIRGWHNQLPILCFRVNNFAYLTDIKSIHEKDKKLLKNLDVLIINAIRKEPHVAHLGLQEALDLIEELAPKKTYLTHISHMQYGYEELLERLPPNVEPAYDGLKIEC